MPLKDIVINAIEKESLPETPKESVWKKTTWNIFLARAREGLSHEGGFSQATKEHIQKAIDVFTKPSPFEPNRKLIGGKAVLRMQKPNGDISYLNKKGKVFEYKNYMLIDDMYMLLLYRFK